MHGDDGPFIVKRYSDESNGLVPDNVCCLVKIIQKDKRIFAAVQFEIKLFCFFSTGINGH